MDAHVVNAEAILRGCLRERHAALTEELRRLAASPFFSWNPRWDLADPLTEVRIRKSACCYLRSAKARTELYLEACQWFDEERALSVTTKLLEELDAKDETARRFPMAALDYLRPWDVEFQGKVD